MFSLPLFGKLYLISSSNMVFEDLYIITLLFNNLTIYIKYLNHHLQGSWRMRQQYFLYFTNCTSVIIYNAIDIPQFRGNIESILTDLHLHRHGCTLLHYSPTMESLFSLSITLCQHQKMDSQSMLMTPLPTFKYPPSHPNPTKSLTSMEKITDHHDRSMLLHLPWQILPPPPSPEKAVYGPRVNYPKKAKLQAWSTFAYPPSQICS